MESLGITSLNDSGADDERAVVLRGGATHQALGSSTSRHAHYAWKLHVGVDAPVWLSSDRVSVPARDGARVLLVPPNFEHETGAVGWSVAMFVEPGTRGAPFRDVEGPRVFEGRLAAAIRDRCLAHVRHRAEHAAAIFEETIAQTFEARPVAVDPRVRRALRAIEGDPSVRLPSLASKLGISVDRLTHLVSLETGTTLRRHSLWQRLLRVLSAGASLGSLARVAQNAGFSDHAHMTRTFRRMLGRAPTDFDAPPIIVSPWAQKLVSSDGPA